jgi:glycerol-3-phosphate dehydrogenase
MELSYKDRAAALQHMARQGVDILVVGGGITGAGVALDAAARGYRVGLVERADFGSGTSSKSTKLVHGGIRYLPQFDFALVHEALVERGLLIRNAPFLVQPIGFVLPLYAENKRPLGTPIVPPGGVGMSYLLQSGLLMYDLMSGRLGVRRHRRLGPRNALRLAPCLKTDGLKDAFIYYDAQTDDTRLTSTVIRTAAAHGAAIANYAEVTGFTQDGGRITAAQVRDRVSGEMLTLRAGTVVNAGGVFAGRIEALVGGESHLQVKPAKGVHLTVPRSVLQMGRDAIVLPETEDGRRLFIVPWGPRVTIGTTDTPGGDVEHPVAEPDDVAYLLRHIERYMSCRLTEADIISAWAGYRPLVSSTRADAASSKLSRTHAVVESPGGMVTIVGGKLTTYRRMAQDTVDHISRAQGDPVVHVTEHLPLAGMMGWQGVAAEVAAAAPRLGLRPDTVRRLGLYGAEAATILALIAEDAGLAARLVPDLPYIMAEVVYACRYEMALDLPDVLERRLHLNFEDWARGRGAAPAVAARMARELGWDAAETARQVESYRAGVPAGAPDVPAPAR